MPTVVLQPLLDSELEERQADYEALVADLVAQGWRASVVEPEPKKPGELRHAGGDVIVHVLDIAANVIELGLAVKLLSDYLQRRLARPRASDASVRSVAVILGPDGEPLKQVFLDEERRES